ncbi:MAG: DUF2188 domain-containing protein [Pseudonocardia sp.]
MSDRHVVPADNGWHVEKDDAQRPSARTATQAEAIKRAVEIVANDGGGQVVIHGSDGQVRETRTVESGVEDTTAEAAKATAAATKAGAEATARSVADDATRMAKNAANDAGDAFDDATDRAGEALEETADRAGEALRDGAASGERWGREMDTAAARTARQVRDLTERAARPLDSSTERLLDAVLRLTRAANPVRVTGRVVEVGARATLGTVGVVSSRGARTARRSADMLTGR